jgi:hypothetical protein
LRATRAWLRSEDVEAGGVEAGGAAICARIDAIEGQFDSSADWRRILTASLLLRLRDLTRIWQDGKAIEPRQSGEAVGPFLEKIS